MTYPDELPARVLALVDGEGYSIKGAAEKVGVPERTAWDWIQRSREITEGNKPLLDRWHRRVSKSLDLMQRGLGVANPVEEQDRIDEEEDREAIKPLLRTHLLNLLGQDLGQGEMTLDEILQQAQTLGPAFGQVFEEILGGDGQPLDRSITTAGTNAGRAGRGQQMSDLQGMNTGMPQ